MFNVGDIVTFKDYTGYCRWYSRSSSNYLQADDLLVVTNVMPSKLAVVCKRAKVGCNIPTEFLQLASTADLDTQPVSVPDMDNGEDTIITRRELDEGR